MRMRMRRGPMRSAGSVPSAMRRRMVSTLTPRRWAAPATLVCGRSAGVAGVVIGVSLRRQISRLGGTRPFQWLRAPLRIAWDNYARLSSGAPPGWKLHTTPGESGKRINFKAKTPGQWPDVHLGTNETKSTDIDSTAWRVVAHDLRLSVGPVWHTQFHERRVEGLTMSFPVPIASKMSGASVAQLAYWRKHDILMPEIECERSPYLYSFRDIVALRTFAWLRIDHSLQAIRRF